MALGRITPVASGRVIELTMTDPIADLLRNRPAPRPTAADARNIATLEAHREDIARVLAEQGDQAGIDYANSLIDTRAGIVGGDGRYYARVGFPG